MNDPASLDRLQEVAMAIGSLGYALTPDSDLKSLMALTRDLNSIFAIRNRRRKYQRPDPIDAA